MREKISVIVPVYNVEKYLHQCIESIRNQTYDYLEIILVDDGSTDSSGEICDKYAEIDSRVKVIHKANGGLSDARNAGMVVATGKYISFVDSDDWINIDMYKHLYTLCEEYQLDLVAARFCEEYDTEYERPVFTNEFCLLTGEDLIKIDSFVDDKCFISWSVWDRLYRRDLLEGIFFPVGKKYEDICFTTKVFLKVKKAGYLDKLVYHYRIRQDGIMGQGMRNENNFSHDVVTDFLPQLREKSDILYEAGYRECGDESRFYYMREILKFADVIYKKESYQADYAKLKEMYVDDILWVKKYVLQKGIFGKAAILVLGSFSVEWYIKLVRLKRWIVKKYK